MFKSNKIKCILEEYIRQGRSLFIIYPFGDNGLLVKNLLRDYFNLQPAYIVDNKYCIYNPEIISYDEMVLKDINDCTVIITVEDEETNCIIENMCLECFDEKHIINLRRLISNDSQLLTWHFLEREYCKEAFCASNFINACCVWGGGADRFYQSKEKIKVRILHNGAHIWNTFETMCSGFGEDSRFEVLLLLCSLTGNTAEMEKQANTGGYRYTNYFLYDPMKDKPDIFIYASPFMKSYVRPICSVAKISFMIPVTLMLYSPNKTDRIVTANKMVQEMEEAGVDYCLAERYLYNNLPTSYKVSILEFGNPKIDILYKLSLKKRRSDSFTKLNDKRVILFATAHGSRNGRFMDGITFDLYAKYIFKFIAENPDYGLIFRPHPLFIAELIESNYWQMRDVIRFKEYMNSTENMIWDDNDTYEEALITADIIITDGYCGMVVSTMPLLKPICALYRDYEIESMSPEVDAFLYVVRDKKELDNFIKQVVIRKEDPMYEMRKSACSNFIKRFDGHNGKRIKEFISLTYFETLKNKL